MTRKRTAEAPTDTARIPETSKFLRLAQSICSSKENKKRRECELSTNKDILYYFLSVEKISFSIFRMTVFVVLYGLGTSNAQALPCGAADKAGQYKCLLQDIEKANVELRRGLDDVKSAADALIASGQGFDFRPMLKKNQQLWESWMKNQCGLEGIATMGSAEPMAEASCRQHLTLDRAKSLESIATQLRP